jgi:hypothetical protein
LPKLQRGPPSIEGRAFLGSEGETIRRIVRCAALKWRVSDPARPERQLSTHGLNRSRGRALRRGARSARNSETTPGKRRPVEAPGPACLDDLQIGLAVAVQQLVSDRSGRVLVGEGDVARGVYRLLMSKPRRNCSLLVSIKPNPTMTCRGSDPPSGRSPRRENAIAPRPSFAYEPEPSWRASASRLRFP